MGCNLVGANQIGNTALYFKLLQLLVNISMTDETMPVTDNVHGINRVKKEWPSTGYHLQKQAKTEQYMKVSWDSLAVWSLPKHPHSDFQIAHMSNGTNTNNNICTAYMHTQT